MKHNQIKPADYTNGNKVFLLETKVVPGVAPLGNTIGISIQKFDESHAVEYPSVEDYARGIFRKTEVKGADARETFYRISQVANAIRAASMRGAGNLVYTSPTTTVDLTATPNYLYKFDTIDWLADDETLTVYHGNAMDVGFVWADNANGKVDVIPTQHAGDFGIFARFV